MLASFSNLAGSAAVQANRTYSPYGTVQYTKGSFSTNKGFTGQYNDPATGLDYYGARYYDPKASVFLSTDSVQGNLQGMNPYTYVGGNPETMNDPTGNWYGPPCYGCGPGHAGGSGGSGGSGGPGGTGGNNGGGNNGGGFIGGGRGSLRLQECRLESICPGQVDPPLTRADLLAICAADPVCRRWEFNQGMEVTFNFLGQVVFFVGNLYDGLSEVQLLMDITNEEGEADAEASMTDPTLAEDQTMANQLEDEGLISKDEAANICSFTASTPVATDHGEQAIGTLKVGEKVLAYNPKTGKMEQEPIVHVWVNHDNDLVDLTLTTATHAPHSASVKKTSEVIHTNQKHPFFTLEHGFVPVGHLHLGMHILRADGNIGVVTGWKVVPGTKAMYNLTVAQDHTFTVGMGQWVVHNTGCGDLNGPNARHFYSNISQKSLAKDMNTVIAPGTDVGTDVDAINAGEVTPVNGTYTVNGRTYGVHNGTLYPISGDGFYQLDRGAYKALGVYRAFGNTARAGEILDNMGMSLDARNAALIMYQTAEGTGD